LEGSVELRVPGPQPCRLAPVPSDKILFPRRMLYVEAVLYLTVAAAAFGLGYLTGRGGPPAGDKEEMRGVEGKVSLVSPSGAKRGDAGAVVIVLPAGKSPGKRLPIAGLRPSDPPPAKGDATMVALGGFGGAATRADESGGFELSVPGAGSYRILVVSRQATRGPDGPLERSDISELEKYFDAPAELLQRCNFRWLTKDLHEDARPIDVAFSE
jgi:hypothetical protein